MAESQQDDDGLPTVHDLDELVSLVHRQNPGDELYVRWSRGPAVDAEGSDDQEQVSRDALTGVPLPGLSANPLRVEPWWGERSPRLWLARKLFDYQHLRALRGARTRAWILVGTEVGRGPDNEPLVRCRRPIAWIDDAALVECERMIAAQPSDEWGTLNRHG